MQHAVHLALHGCVILVVGLLCGIQLGRVIVRGRHEHVVRAWGVAHASLVTGGTLLIAVSAVALQLRLQSVTAAVMCWIFMAAGYVFAVVLPLSAMSGQRGLDSSPPAINRALYAGNVAGAIGILVASLLLIVLLLSSLD